MAHMLSVGLPSTLESYLSLSNLLFGPESGATKHIQGLINDQGPQEEVVADEGQMIYLLTQLHPGGSA